MDISEASTNEDDLTDQEKNARVFATQMLKQRIFAGHFMERRRVEPLNDYRDVIVVNDDELKKDMDIVRKRLRNVYRNTWIGITGPDSIGAPYGHCFWITIDDKPIGNYLYQIKSVKFRRNEIIVRLKNLKSLDELATYENTSSVEAQVSEYFQNFNWDNARKQIIQTVMDCLYWCITSLIQILTVENIKTVATYLVLLVCTAGAFSIEAVKYLMDFILKFMRELTYLVRAFTPVMQSTIDVFGKIIGGFYFLIASIYRDSKGVGPPPQRSQTQVQYQQRQRYLPIEGRQRQVVNYYRPRSSMTITEIVD